MRWLALSRLGFDELFCFAGREGTEGEISDADSRCWRYTVCLVEWKVDEVALAARR